jgi:hypothetical protein
MIQQQALHQHLASCMVAGALKSPNFWQPRRSSKEKGRR